MSTRSAISEVRYNHLMANTKKSHRGQSPVVLQVTPASKSSQTQHVLVCFWVPRSVILGPNAKCRLGLELRFQVTPICY